MLSYEICSPETDGTDSDPDIYLAPHSASTILDREIIGKN
jgi:hypothetical protein